MPLAVRLVKLEMFFSRMSLGENDCFKSDCKHLKGDYWCLSQMETRKD